MCGWVGLWERGCVGGAVGGRGRDGRETGLVGWGERGSKIRDRKRKEGSGREEGWERK